uniref:Protein FAM32A n=1 Tax=Sus scrofa TaxID=9823 RepID=A0A4X1SRV6_PIG
MEAHEHVQQGPPKLKGGPELRAIRRKKKKKAKDKAKLPEGMGTIRRDKEEKPPGLDVGTPAQAAFEKMQEERQGERIPKKASRTHSEGMEANIGMRYPWEMERWNKMKLISFIPFF